MTSQSTDEFQREGESLRDDAAAKIDKIEAGVQPIAARAEEMAEDMESGWTESLDVTEIEPLSQPASDLNSRKVKLSLEVTPELNHVIERIAEATGTTKTEAMRKAIVLMDVATEAKANGERLFVAKEPPPGVSREIIGL